MKGFICKKGGGGGEKEEGRQTLPYLSQKRLELLNTLFASCFVFKRNQNLFLEVAEFKYLQSNFENRVG